MKITSSLIDKLIRLRSGEYLPSSVLRGDWVEDLLREGVLISCSHGSRSRIKASSPQTLEQSLIHIDERFGDLDSMKGVIANDIPRSVQAAATGNSKLVMVRSCPGFPVNSYDSIPCSLNGRDIMINPEEGTFVFISDWQSFEIPEDVLIMNIENMENFRMIRQQRTLFTAMFPNKRLLFVSRYPQSSDLRTWLERIPNLYVHFGDFDLAGIHIFLSEFHKYLGERASFLIPHDIEERLQQGSMERYNAQYNKFKNISSGVPSLQLLINMINKYHRCYDQEGYIQKK